MCVTQNDGTPIMEPQILCKWIQIDIIQTAANFEPWPHGHFTKQVYSLNILCSKDFYCLSRKGIQMHWRTISSSRNFATALQGIGPGNDRSEGVL